MGAWPLSLVMSAATVASSSSNNQSLDCSSPSLRSLPYCNPDSSHDQRVADVLSRLSPGQKVTRLVNDPSKQPAGEGAGLPTYAWGVEGQVMSFNQCFNSAGCADPGTPLCHLCGPTFPMPPALASAWNLTLIEEVGSLVGDSVRALDNWNRNLSAASTSAPAPRALSVRGPYLNVMRDPRDGRNQERPSEDPWYWYT